MTKLVNKAIRIARKEVREQTFGVTEQFYSVHKPVLRRGVPHVAYVDTTTEVDAFHVYFSTEDEPYYFVVVVRLEEGELALGWMYTQAAVAVRLIVRSETLMPDEITRLLGIEPTSTHSKGTQLRLFKGTHKSAAPPTKFSLWRFEPHPTVLGAVEDKLDLFLDTIEPHADKIIAFERASDDLTYIYVHVLTQDYKEFMNDWRLSIPTLQRLAAMHVDVNADVGASGADIPFPWQTK